MPITPIAPSPHVFDDDDDEGWQDMPIVREDEFASGLDEEDQKKYHYQPSAKGTSAANATGNLIDVDDYGNEWRSKLDQNESEYTRLRVNEEEDADEVHLRTKYLFDEDKAMTPLSQMQATKNLLTDAQRIAYVGLCALTSREMSHSLKVTKRKELKAAVSDMELWAMKIMGRLYYHMELETQEQKMIESLAEHGVVAMDLVPALMTTHTVANPEYDPAEARRLAEEREKDDVDNESISDQTLVDQPLSPEPDPTTPKPFDSQHTPNLTPDNSMTQISPSKNVAGAPATHQTTAKVLGDTSTTAIPGVTTSLSSADQNVTLDIRWTVLCDLFLVLIADSVYDARSRVLLESVAFKLGLGWLDLVKFESRVTEALEIQEDVEKMEQQEVIQGQQKAMKKKRYVMLGLATLGGGLVIGLSAGLLAPVIGAGLGAALTTIGISGSAGFLAGVGGTAVITTGGVLTGSSIAARGMAKRTQLVRTFDILPLHNNKRVSCILTVPGFMTGPQDDVRLPFSVLDPIVGDVFSVLWEPEMIQETGSALKILTGEVLSQIGMTVLQATVMSAFMTALQWPIILTKLGYLIDNPWNNALDRARGAGRVLAEVLMHRHLGVRPITLIGFSLGARVIFYALLELAKHKAFGIVQDVFMLGATLTASTKSWCEVRSVVSGRFVNAFSRNDWVLNYLFRATSGGVGTVAGLRPVLDVPGLENVDVTDKIAGHMSYRAFMPLILDQLGFPVSADYFDEPEEPDFTEDRIVVTEEDSKQKKGWFSRKKKPTTPQKVSRPPSAASTAFEKAPTHPQSDSTDDDLPPRMHAHISAPSTSAEHGQRNAPTPASGTSTPPSDAHDSTPHLPAHAGFDLNAIKAALEKEVSPEELKFQVKPVTPGIMPPPTERSESAPPQHRLSNTSISRPPLDSYHSDAVPGPSSIPREDLSTTFSRTLSLPDVHDDYSEYDEPIPYQTQSTFGGNAYENTSRPSPSPSPYAATPFANDTLSSWGSPTRSDKFPYSTTSAFGAAPSMSSFNFSHPSPPNIFPGAGLSFGGADGSITVSPGADPWKVPSDLGSGKKTPGSGYNQNPWS
ncbi:hypothetical protein D9615_000938 [Tricholomella constricta]|uniref:DUF726-domain-containing protein n=1 Tax=Tricholomella constricta TaxID=117010 RepID=A0A8H5HLA9_9AGAR|nr:hypothetical protein D9615_000938 [Tricholomella constricta]